MTLGKGNSGIENNAPDGGELAGSAPHPLSYERNEPSQSHLPDRPWAITLAAVLCALPLAPCLVLAAAVPILFGRHRTLGPLVGTLFLCWITGLMARAAYRAAVLGDLRACHRLYYICVTSAGFLLAGVGCILFAAIENGDLPSLLSWGLPLAVFDAALWFVAWAFGRWAGMLGRSPV